MVLGELALYVSSNAWLFGGKKKICAKEEAYRLTLNMWSRAMNTAKTSGNNPSGANKAISDLEEMLPELKEQYRTLPGPAKTNLLMEFNAPANLEANLRSLISNRNSGISVY